MLLINSHYSSKILCPWGHNYWSMFGESELQPRRKSILRNSTEAMFLSYPKPLNIFSHAAYLKTRMAAYRWATKLFYPLLISGCGKNSIFPPFVLITSQMSAWVLMWALSSAEPLCPLSRAWAAGEREREGEREGKRVMERWAFLSLFFALGVSLASDPPQPSPLTACLCSRSRLACHAAVRIRRSAVGPQSQRATQGRPASCDSNAHCTTTAASASFSR